MYTLNNKFIQQIIESMRTKNEIGSINENQTTYYCLQNVSLSRIMIIAELICLWFVINNQLHLLKELDKKLKNFSHEFYFEKRIFHPYFFQFLTFVNSISNDNNNDLLNICSHKNRLQKIQSNLSKNDFLKNHFVNVIKHNNNKKSIRQHKEKILAINILTFLKYLRKDIQRKIEFINQEQYKIKKVS